MTMTGGGEWALAGWLIAVAMVAGIGVYMAHEWFGNWFRLWRMRRRDRRAGMEDAGYWKKRTLREQLDERARAARKDRNLRIAALICGVAAGLILIGLVIVLCQTVNLEGVRK